jgi:hypothetical protein
MLITKEYTTLHLVKTRQKVVVGTSRKGLDVGPTYLVIGPATDGTWMIKTLSDPDWTTVDTKGQCHNRFYDGYTRAVLPLELAAYQQHLANLGQLCLFK